MALTPGGKGLHFERVNTKRHWVMRKPWGHRVAWTALELATLLPLFYSIAVRPGVAMALQAEPLESTPVADIVLRVVLWGLFGGGFAYLLWVMFAHPLFSFVISFRCPECGWGGRLTRTGQTRGRATNLIRSVLAAVLMSTVEEEWSCKRCGFKVWRAEPRVG